VARISESLLNVRKYLLEKYVNFLLLKEEMPQKMIVIIQTFAAESKNGGFTVAFFLLHKKIRWSTYPHGTIDTIQTP
jgi:hypothetical protein